MPPVLPLTRHMKLPDGTTTAKYYGQTPCRTLSFLKQAAWKCRRRQKGRACARLAGVEGQALHELADQDALLIPGHLILPHSQLALPPATEHTPAELHVHHRAHLLKVTHAGTHMDRQWHQLSRDHPAMKNLAAFCTSHSLLQVIRPPHPGSSSAPLLMLRPRLLPPCSRCFGIRPCSCPRAPCMPACCSLSCSCSVPSKACCIACICCSCCARASGSTTCMC